MIAWPSNRSLSVAGRMMLDTVRRTVRHLVEKGEWELAEFASVSDGRI
jgi:hypothetical protein